MARSINKRTLWVQAAVVILIASGLLAWLVYAETRPLDRNELKIEVAHLRSYSSEAGLLAEQTLSAKTRQTFFETQVYSLRDKTESSRSSLESAKVEQGLETKHWQARQLAEQLKLALESLSSSFARPEDLNSSKDNFKGLLSQVKALEESLQE